MSNKKTQRDYYNELLTNYNLSQEHIDFINSRLQALDKKASRTAPTPTQLENIDLSNDILAWLAQYPNGKTTKEISNHFGKTSQKITPIMKKLIDSEKVSFKLEKKVKIFTITNQG